METDVRSVMVYVGLDLLGDGLMKLPFVRALRTALPDARITWVAGKGKSAYAGKLAPLVAGYLDEVIDDAAIGSNVSDLLSRPLDGRRFDLVVDTQTRLLTTLVLRRIDHGRFVSGCANFLFTRPHGDAVLPGRKPPAMIDRLLLLVALASGRTVEDVARAVGDAGPFDLPETVLAEAARLLPDEAGPAVALAPGAGRRDKCWPLERYGALAEDLADRGFRAQIVLGPDEAEWEAPLREMAPRARFPLSEPGIRLDLEPLLTIGLAARCAACVANDSGIGHLFAASGSPLVSLFGPTSVEKFAPRCARLTTISADAFGDTAMTAIPLDAVRDAVLATAGR